MLPSKPNIRELDRGMNKAFENGRGRAQPWYTSVATVTPSSHRSEVYPFGARVGKMRKWVGNRVAKQLSNFEYVLVNETYEETIEVPVDAWEDATLGQYLQPMDELGYGASKWPDELVKFRMQNGKSGAASLGFDGQPFFSTTHDLNPDGNQSNLFTALPLNATNLETVAVAMRQFKDEVGNLMGAGRLTLIVPPNLELTAKSIVNTALVNGGDTNVMQNYVDVLVLDELEDEPTTWYLADLTKSLKPFIFQRRMAPSMTSKISDDDDNVFDLDVFRWGTKARGVAGYGPWWLCSRVEAT